MSNERPIQGQNRALARQITNDVRANPQSAYTGKVIGLAGGAVARVADDWDDLARWLQQDSRVEWVSYPGLETHSEHRNAKRYLEGGFGGVLTFGVKGGHAAAKGLIDRVKLYSLLALVRSVRTSRRSRPVSRAFSTVAATASRLNGLFK